MVKLFDRSDGSVVGIWVREASKCWNIPRLLPSISFQTHFILPQYSKLNTESTPLNETGSSDLLPLDGNHKIIGYIETFLLPTDAHNVKKHRVIKTF